MSSKEPEEVWFNQEEILEHAKKFIETQEEINEEPTFEGWLKILKDDFVEGIEESIEFFIDTWKIIMDYGVKDQ